MRLMIVLFLFQFTLFQFSNAQDWPNLSRYRDSNEILMRLPNPGDRVVFMGNSITDSWIVASPDFFEKNHFVDRGISGQTSPQMLIRFREDVINLHPKAVVLLCGTNDIAGNTGPSTLEMIEDNITSMAELAKENKIKVFLCSVLPAIKYNWKPDIEPADKIIALNAWIKDYADKNKMIYLDYYSSMVNNQKGMKAEYSEDGVHPNKAGYQVMEKLAGPVIKKSIKEKLSLF
jgi:lysophospholipase L1-like esterase